MFDTNAQVTLTATPASGSTFAGWSGGGCSGTGTCTVTLSSTRPSPDLQLPAVARDAR